MKKQEAVIVTIKSLSEADLYGMGKVVISSTYMCNPKDIEW